jgi:hypothetical protein
VARQTTLIFVASCVCIGIFFWVGGIFISTPQADIVALRRPTWDEAKWWIGRPDTGFYIDIAEHGYRAGPYSPAVTANWAFFPAYPLLLRLLAHGRSAETYLVAGFLLSVLFYGLSVLYLRKLLFTDYDYDTVIRAILLLCFYPFAFSLAIFGPDSLCLLTACAAFYYARRGQWALAGLAAALACVTRVQGVLVVPCVLYMYLRTNRLKTNRAGRSILPLVFAPVTLGAFMFHLWKLTGNPLAFIGIQQAWNNALSWPFAFLVRFFREPALIGSNGWDPALLSIAATVAMLAVLAWCLKTRSIPMEYCLFFALHVVVLTCRTSTLGNLRYITNCFPFFLAVAILAKRPLAFSLVLAAFAGFFGLCASLFAAGQQHHPGYHFVAF